MKKIFLILCLSFSLLFSFNTFAIDQKVKVIGTMAGYGMVGGALLGAASMAFDASARSIARGASLGLYGGLLFGTYVILSYEMKKRGYSNEPQSKDYYPDSSSPYEDQTRIQNLSEFKLASLENKKDPRKDPLFLINFSAFEF